MHVHLVNIMILIRHYANQFLHAHKDSFTILKKEDAYQKLETLSNVHMENTIVTKLVNVNKFLTALKG